MIGALLAALLSAALQYFFVDAPLSFVAVGLAVLIRGLAYQLGETLIEGCVTSVIMPPADVRG